MNVVMVSSVTMNPYVRLLGSALERLQAGVGVAYEPALTPSVAARLNGKTDVLHIHWPETLVRGRSLRSSLSKLGNLALGLWQARRRGIAIVYTAHNIRRSGDGVGVLGGLAEELVYRSAAAVHVHDEGAQAELAQRKPARRCAVIAHGNYIGAYPNTTDRSAARERLQIAPDAFVYLALGQIRQYKGLDELIAAFRSLPGEHLRLVIAGHPQQPQDGARLQALAGSDGRISVRASFVADDEIQYYMHACDVCVLPYRSGTTSGAAILALSFGRSVIAPGEWPFRGLLRDGGGLLYPAGADGLRGALESVAPPDPQSWGEGAEAPASAKARREGAEAPTTAKAWGKGAVGALNTQALAAAERLEWLGIAQQHLDVYRQVTGRQGGSDD